jgi:excisionase family DNA binding protein
MSLLNTSVAPLRVGADDRLRPKEAAQIARVSVGMIYRWLHEGRFKSWTVTRRGFERGVRYIDRSTFENFLKSQREEIPA